MNAPTEHLIIAPIRGVTNFVYRNTLHNTFGGADSALAPYIVTKGSNELNQRQLHDVSLDKNLIPTTAQILTKDADQFLFAASRFKELGVKRVNLNMGCPYPMVANRTKGSGLLHHPKKVEGLLTEIKKNCPIEFSVKVRLGRTDVNEIKKIIPIINDLDISDFTIHSRTGIQIYKGDVDLDAFEACLPLLNHTPCYNGDVRSVGDYIELKKRFPAVTNWMIGRGLLCNPALLSQIKGMQYTEQAYRELLIRFHKSLSMGHMEFDNAKSDFLPKMRGHWEYLKDVFEDSHKVHKKIKKVRSISQYHDAASWIFEQKISSVVLN